MPFSEAITSPGASPAPVVVIPGGGRDNVDSRVRPQADPNGERGIYGFSEDAQLGNEALVRVDRSISVVPIVYGNCRHLELKRLLARAKPSPPPEQQDRADTSSRRSRVERKSKRRRPR